ncbi:hypothetical protein K3495_g12165 [Podosphaera aphanis]|nr:hypothetical protein K3495_g12165 [Podosphaera aphanis]
MEPAYVRIENLNLSNAKNEEFDVYAKGKLKFWIKMEWRDENLWEVFQEDFGYFDWANFEKKDKPILRKIRDHLRANGVFVQKQQRYKIAKALAEIATEENPSVWPQEDIKEQMEKGGAFNSYRANKPSIFASSLSGAKQITVKNETPTYSDFNNGRTNIVAQNTNISSKGSDLTDSGKNYTSDMKYRGNDDRFDYKLSIFYDICNRTNLPDCYYYRTLLPKITPEISFEKVIHSIKNNFEGEAYQRLVKQKWRKVNMTSMIADAPEKSLSEILETMIQKLQDLQLGLAPKYRDDDYLRDKLIEACEGIAAFQNACYRPDHSLEEFINDLRSSVLAHEKSIESTSSALFTDRRFHKRNEGFGSHKNTGRNTNPWNKNSQKRSQYKKKCFICKQENCWSTKHPKKEREDYRYNLLRNVNNRETFDNENKALILLSDELDLNASDSESFLTSFGHVDGLKMITTLSNNVTFHATTKDSLQSQEDPFSYATNKTATCFIIRYDRDTFYGILIDTGASLRSTAGYEQYVAYKNLQNNFDAKITLDKTKAGVVNVQFGIGSTSSIGSITINTPIGVIEFHVVEADIPSLLSLNDMDRLQVKLDNLNNVLIQRGKEFPVTRRFGHVFLLDEITFKSSDCFLSEQELPQLYRRFGHPSANRLYNLLHQSNHKVHREAIERLNKFCLICQKNGQSPRRFKFSLHDDSIDFNHSIYIDIMYIDSKPVLHVVDEATRFQAARWLTNMSIQSTWDALRLCWIDVYVGPPNCITHDAGSNYTSQEFQQYASSMAISTKCVPVEAVTDQL